MLPAGNTTKVSHLGSSTVLGRHDIHNVMYIPKFQHNLLSVSKLTKELNCSVHFYLDFCTFQDLFSGKVKGTGKHVHGLYVVDSPCLNVGHDKPACIKTRCHSVLVEKSKNKTDIDLWHKRLGHAPLNTLKNLNCYVDNVNFDHKYYTVCSLAKQTRIHVPLSTSQSDACFRIIHGDVWGPYRVPTYDRKKYFLTLVDDYSRYTWIFLLNSKSEVIVALTDFLLMLKNVHSAVIKILRTSNGCEFF